jgi:flavin reductase
MTEDHATEETVRSAFKLAMRWHAANVCIVSAGEDETVNGMAITAATSFSMDPPSVMLCLNEAASLTADLALESRFGLAILGRGHEPVAAAFSRKPSGPSRFAHGDWTHGAGLPPRLADAVANLSCTVVRRMSYGSHVAIIGRVEDVHLGPEGPSLIYRAGQYALA